MTRPRYTFTDTGELEALLDAAQRRWPEIVDRKALLLRPAAEGGSAPGLETESVDVEEQRKRTQAALGQLRSLVDVELLLPDSAWRRLQPSASGGCSWTSQRSSAPRASTLRSGSPASARSRGSSCAETIAIARTAQRELAVKSRHRVPIPDLLIAACAHQHQAAVLHLDRHYSTLARVLTFTPVRLEGVQS